MIVLVPAASAMVVPLTLKLTVAVSLSVIATVPVSVEPRAMPEDGFDIVSVAVSVPSTNVSFRMVNVEVPVVAPLEIVMVETEKLPSVEVMFVPEEAIFTV